MSKSNFVHIVCILDRSGSMGSLAVEVINSFNHFIQEQKAEPGKAKLTLVLFDNEIKTVYDRIKLKDVPELTSTEYYARGLTSLYDAIGTTLNRIEDDNVMVLIQTDGHENSSREYSQSDIKSLIEAKEDQGWDFTFLGANIDAADVGTGFGLSLDKTVQYAASNAGVSNAFVSMDASTKMYRNAKAEEFKLQ